MQVDEPRRHHQPAGIDDFLAGYLLLGNDRDRVTLNSYISHRIEPGVRIDDPTAGDGNVVDGGVLRMRRLPSGTHQDERENQRGCALPNFARELPYGSNFHDSTSIRQLEGT